MRAMLRYMLTGSAAVAVTAMLFYTMTLLIATEHRAGAPQSEQLTIIFEDMQLPELPEKKRPPKPEPPKPRELPPPESSFNTPEPELAFEPLPIDRSSLRPGPGVNVIEGTLPGMPGTQADGETFALTAIRPHYPRQAALNRIEGWVTIEFVVTAAGRVSDARVIAAEPAGIFDEAALKGISQWKFKPAMKNGQPISRRARQTLEFKLDHD